MLIASEIVEIIQEVTDDKREQVLIINELREAIEYNPKRLSEDLKEEAEDIADGNFCPKCTSNIAYETHSESHEYFGQPTFSYITVGECENSNCGYTTED